MPSDSLFRHFLSRSFSTRTQQPFTPQFLTLLAALSSTPNHPKTLSSLDSLLDSHSQFLDPSTSLLVLRGLSLLKKLTRAKSFLLNLKQSNRIPPHFLYSVTLQCVLRDATIRDVETFWSDVNNPNPCINISDFIVYLCRHCHNASEIERVFLRISSNNWRVSRQAYISMIGALCRTNDPNRHLGRFVLNEMVEKGMDADDLSYFDLFRSSCRAGNVLEADSVLRDWRNRGEFELDCSIYGNFFYGLCQSGKYREARKLFDKLTKREGAVSDSSLLRPRRRAIFQLMEPGTIHKVTAFETYFRALCSFGRVDEAERLLKVVMKKSAVPEVCVYNCFVKALFRAGRVDDALQFFETQRRKSYVSGRDITTSVIYGLCEIGRIDDACKLVSEMIREGFVPTARTWNRIIKSYWETGSEEKAISLFEQMQSGNCDICRTRPDTESYSIMIGWFLEQGKVEMGISLLDVMTGKKFKAGVDLHIGIVRGLHKCGRVEEADKWLNQMIENGTLVSYDAWKTLHDSIAMEGDGNAGEFWKAIEANYNKTREDGKRKVKKR